jgi:hypothetical protein
MRQFVPGHLFCVQQLLDMTSDDDWLTADVVEVSIDELTPTQPCLLIDRVIELTADGKRRGDDRCAHVVKFNGQLYIDDGHHDCVLRWLRGERSMLVKLVQIDVACTMDKPCCHVDR